MNVEWMMLQLGVLPRDDRSELGTFQGIVKVAPVLL